MGAAMLIGGALMGTVGSIVSATNKNSQYEETEKLIAEEQKKEEDRRKAAEEQAKQAYEKEQKMMSLKDQALHEEIQAEQKYKNNNSTILTDRMVDRSSLQTQKETLGSF